MLGIGSLFLLSIGLTTGLKIAREFPIFRGETLGGNFFWNAAPTIIAIVLTFLTFLFLYRVVPNTRVRWRDIWIGAVIATFLFEIVKNIFVWYVAKCVNYSLVYGPVGAVIMLPTWTYLSAVILLFGAKFCSVYAVVRNSSVAEMQPVERHKKVPRLVWSPPKSLLAAAMLMAIGFDALRRSVLRRH